MQNQPIQGLSGNLPAASTKTDQVGQGPAFRALLDRLEAQAQGLADTSETIQDSAGLVDAVGQSERALEQARQLTDQLLEAFRANQTRLSA
ncbi:MAG TPA: hypothetical protein P5218_05160 [Planctomycetota bacterium]|nr:hypothetical protein [Planctomycetota bacterium]HRV80800.1 hypothetical protein [Planctomycetota bacterium]